MVLLMIRLGFWQLDRAAEKVELHQHFAERATAPRLSLDGTATEEASDELWRPALLSGTPMSPMLLLDNRVRNGIPGYEVLTPVRLPDSRTVLLNRGWLKAPQRRDEWPEIAPLGTLSNARGRIAPAPSTGIRLGNAAPERGPDGTWRIQDLDFPRLSKTLKTRLEPYQILLDADQAGGFDRAWILPDPSSAKHEAYAFQWFAMAAALFFLTLYHGLRRTGPQPSSTP